jgi:hypothetical protein
MPSNENLLFLSDSKISSNSNSFSVLVESGVKGDNSMTSSLPIVCRFACLPGSSFRVSWQPLASKPTPHFGGSRCRVGSIGNSCLKIEMNDFLLDEQQQMSNGMHWDQSQQCLAFDADDLLVSDEDVEEDLEGDLQEASDALRELESLQQQKQSIDAQCKEKQATLEENNSQTLSSPRVWKDRRTFEVGRKGSLHFALFEPPEDQETADKIKCIVEHEFDAEIENKTNQLLLLDQRLSGKGTMWIHLIRNRCHRLADKAEQLCWFLEAYIQKSFAWYYLHCLNDIAQTVGLQSNLLLVPEIVQRN